MCIVVVIGFVPDNVTAVEGVDRSLNLTAEVIAGELGLDVAIGIIPESTTFGMLCMITLLILVSVQNISYNKCLI